MITSCDKTADVVIRVKNRTESPESVQVVLKIDTGCTNSSSGWNLELNGLQEKEITPVGSEKAVAVDVRVLAATLDNSFISPKALENIATVCGSLGVDNLLLRPNPTMLRRIFSTAARQELFSLKTLERASSICTSCITFVKGMVLRTALEKNIPFIGWGWSPGQAPIQSSVMKTNPALMQKTQQATFKLQLVVHLLPGQPGSLGQHMRLASERSLYLSEPAVCSVFRFHHSRSPTTNALTFHGPSQAGQIMFRPRYSSCHGTVPPQ
jgi:hypothetical protein